ncbi:hypothetical protein [Burkholderia sp. MSMB1826]|uniref:hypothetical protein n=1 Tax=Burkholderia sp. MSMB1826 TaxID=1637875 RepID=UPI000758C2FF|nr:hypothetical protein [Burkholderia sp. MSMB1826]KVL23411.1 hypothetical protein WS95_07185 [Burkholderia sp. MSMB1826]
MKPDRSDLSRHATDLGLLFLRVAASVLLLVVHGLPKVVHPDWPLRDAQFAWMLLILFGTIAIAGAGRYVLPLPGVVQRRG